MSLKAENDNERVTLEFFTALDRGNFDRASTLLDENASWTPQTRGAEVRRGRKVIMDFMTAPTNWFVPGELRMNVDTIASKGPLVLAEARIDGRLKDGRQFGNVYVWAVEVREQKIHVIREYLDSHYNKLMFSGPKKSVT